MKKLFGICAVLLLVGALSGCGKQDDSYQPDPDFQPSSEMEAMADMAQ